jgi:DNA-directed RNA polymerase specialized sigma24 family protein
MDEHDLLVERFESERPQLQAMAYRMLGSLSEAEDAVQESWLHLVRADRSSIKNLGAWLTRAVARSPWKRPCPRPSRESRAESTPRKRRS